MDRYARLFEKYYEYTHTQTRELLEHWRVHTNRRTIVLSVAVGAIAIVGYLFTMRAPDDFPLNQLVEIPKGLTDQQIAEKLEESHVIRSPLMFRAVVMITGSGGQLHAGDYMFKEPKDLFSVAQAISEGAFGLEPYRIRIPEGAMTKDMAAIFGAALPRFNKEKFMEVAEPMEGYLFPDTYFFLPNATEDTVIETMRSNFDTHIAMLEEEIAEFGKPFTDVVIMASIVEREARKYEDRRMIAGVLWRRLDKGMPLQADVTFLYTIGKGTFDLSMDDLRSDSPYNTYKNKGLPPTPIGSPSLASLQASLTPIDKGYLFYLADNSGVTHFSKTYAQHQEYKRMYLGN